MRAAARATRRRCRASRILGTPESVFLVRTRSSAWTVQLRVNTQMTLKTHLHGVGALPLHFPSRRDITATRTSWPFLSNPSPRQSGGLFSSSSLCFYSSSVPCMSSSNICSLQPGLLLQHAPRVRSIFLSPIPSPARYIRPSLPRIANSARARAPTLASSPLGQSIPPSALPPP